MAIKIELNETYGMSGIEEVMETIKAMKKMGLTDDEINEVLECSKKGGTE